MGLIKISPAFAKNENFKVQCNNSPTSTEIPDFANQLTISRADEGTRAWRLDSAATVKTRVGSVAIQNMERDAPWTAWIKMIQQRGEAFSSTLDFRL
jgi:hypothetical protein